MKAEIITIGEEILIGQIVDTNSAFMGEQLSLNGIKVCKIVSVSDKKEDILLALSYANASADLVLITGGLGPTKDDISKNVYCEFFKTKLVFSEEAYGNIERIFRHRKFKVNELNRNQAEVLENCTPLINAEGTASGMWMEKDNTIFVAMPGVPFEMKTMLTNQVIPRLKERFKLPQIVQKTINTQGAYEGMLAETLGPWEEKLAENQIDLAWLPNPGIIQLRLTKAGEDREQILRQFDEAISELDSIIPGKIFGFDSESLAEVCGRLLMEQQKSLATAESCTGGHIGHLITSVPGSSGYFQGAVVAYSNEIKEKVLKVNTKSLIDQGAVSEQVVKEMAIGVMNLMNTDYAVATSGIAGPDGGTDDKPVGTTWIAVASKNNIITRKFLFGEHRGRNIMKTSHAALNMLRKMIISEK